jgi:hypothetical protein
MFKNANSKDIVIIVSCLLLLVLLLRKRLFAPIAPNFTPDDFTNTPALDYAYMANELYAAMYGSYFTDEVKIIQVLSQLKTKDQYKKLSEIYIYMFPPRNSWEFWKKGSKTGSLEGDLLLDLSDTPEELQIVKNILQNLK